MSASRPGGRDPQRSRTSRRSRTRGPARTTPTGPEPLLAGGATTALLDPPPQSAPPQEPATGGTGAERRRSTARLIRPRAPRHRLLLVCTGVLAVGLLGVLLLNTIISQGAFRQHELEVQLILIAEEEEALARSVQQAEAPIEVERRARELGMVPAAAPVFLRLSDGAILGEPVPAPEAPGPVDFTDAPGLLPPDEREAAGRQAAEAPAAQGRDDTAVGDELIDPALDPATGLDQPPASPSPSPAPSQPSDAATPGPAPGAGRDAPATTTQGATP